MPNQNQRPSSWVNLQDYLGLNQDQATEMGNRLNQGVRGKAQAAKQQLGAAAGNFQTQANAGTLSDPNAKDPSGQTYGSKAAPTAAKATELASREYGGPRQLGDVDAQVGASVADAVARLNAAKTNSGQAALMREEFKTSASPYYGTGASGLDAFLAGQGGAESLAATQSQFGGLEKELGVAQESAAKYGDAALAKHNAARGFYAGLAPGLQAQESAVAADRENKELLRRVNEAASMSFLVGGAKQGQKEAQQQADDYRFWHSGMTPEQVRAAEQRKRNAQRNPPGQSRSDGGSLPTREPGFGW